MYAQHALAAIQSGSGMTRRGRRVGFSAFGDDGGASGIIPVSGPDVTAADVLTRVRLNGGSMQIANDSSEYATIAKANPSLFTVTDAGHGLIKITENKAADYSQYILYGGLALGAVLLIGLLKR